MRGPRVRDHEQVDLTLPGTDDEVREDARADTTTGEIATQPVQDVEFVPVLDGVTEEHLYMLLVHLMPDPRPALPGSVTDAGDSFR